MPFAHDRRVFIAGLATATLGGLALPRRAFAQDTLTPTPACDDGDEPTPRQTEGPFFTPSSPERSALREDGMAGTPIALSGVVLTRSCRPVAVALVDLWHADDAGDYDNSGFRFRGHQFTDADGGYRFRTIRPGSYAGRTAHFHVKVQAAGGRILTTQLYFPNEPANLRDSLFRRDLLMKVVQTGDGQGARFDFVLDIR